MQNMKKKSAISFILVSLLSAGAMLTGCRQLDIYEKNTVIPRYEWSAAFRPSFEFNITDTSAAYQLLLVLRHTDAYRYNNIWLQLTGVYNGKDTLLKMPHLELQLGNDEHGWEGTGMDDIWEVRKPVSNGPIQFRKPGRYQFQIAQIMRENPLPNVMSVGLRVEKVRPR